MRRFPLRIVAILIGFLWAACTVTPTATPLASPTSSRLLPGSAPTRQGTTEASSKSTLGSTPTSSLTIKAATPTPQPTSSAEGKLTPSPQTLVPTPIGVTGSGLQGRHFVVGDNPFQFLGVTVQNQWSKQTGNPSFDNDPARIDELIRSAKATGIAVLLIEELPLFERELGVYQESQLVKLDRLLDGASRNGVYVIIPFIHGYGIALSPEANPYYNPGGIEGLVKDQGLREAFKKRIAALIKRVNTVNGRRYSEDSTIFAWMLAQEPVSAAENYPKGPPSVTTDDMAVWVKEMASYVKTLDGNHLLTIEAPLAIAKGYGANWSAVFQSSDLDFLRLGDAEGRIIHLTQDDYFDFHQKVFALGKPVLMQFSFDGGAVNQQLYSKDYVWQAEKLRAIFKAYYEMGVAAGFVVYSWGSDLDVAWSPDKAYTYTASNKPMAQALLDIATTLGPRNSTTLPLDFVRIRY